MVVSVQSRKEAFKVLVTIQLWNFPRNVSLCIISSNWVVITFFQQRRVLNSWIICSNVKMILWKHQILFPSRDHKILKTDGILTWPGLSHETLKSYLVIYKIWEQYKPTSLVGRLLGWFVGSVVFCTADRLPRTGLWVKAGEPLQVIFAI